MLPTFRFWIENQEETEDQSNVSEPQHKAGENLLSVNQNIEKRILEIIEELNRTGKATKNQVIDALKYFLDKNAPKENPSQNSQNTNLDPQAPQPPQGPQGAPG